MNQNIDRNYQLKMDYTFKSGSFKLFLHEFSPQLQDPYSFYSEKKCASSIRTCHIVNSPKEASIQVSDAVQRSDITKSFQDLNYFPSMQSNINNNIPQSLPYQNSLFSPLTAQEDPKEIEADPQFQAIRNNLQNVPNQFQIESFPREK